MRLLIIKITILAILSSCGSKTELDNLKSEIADLKMKNKKLQTQLTRFDNSIVINSEEIDEFIMPLTFGPMEVKPNEVTTFETHLVLKKLPDNIQTNWTCSPEGMAIKNQGLGYYVTNSYESKRDLEFKGTYNLIFPNGDKKELYWLRDFKVK
jgi:hypothetical protein